MMNFLGKKLLTILSLLCVMVVVSCVPTASKKNAQCASGQVFSNVTRSCYTLTHGRQVPVATLGSDSIQQETSKLVTLAYTDANNDPAISCRVIGATPEIETISPVLFNGKLFAAVDTLYAAVSTLSTNLTTAGVAEAPAVATALTQIDDYRTLLKKSFVQQLVQSNLTNFRVAVEGVISLSAAAYNANLYPSVMSAYTLAASRLADLVPLSDFMTNQCACSAGVCSTYVVTKIRQNGSAGFNYSITDVDGESTLKNVVVAVQSMTLASAPQYAPTAEGLGTTFSFAESATDTPQPETQQLPSVFGDYFPSLVTNYTYHVSTNPTKGTVSCTAIGFCTYTPFSGNENSNSPVLLPAAAAASVTTASGITFNAKAIGTAGNNIRVNFYSLHSNNLFVDGKSSPSENFGLVNANPEEGYVRVIGSTISVFVNPTITTLTNVVSLINADEKANKLVTATGIGVLPIGSLPVNAVLVGGVDDYDKFSYYVSNGYANSAPVDVVINVTPTDDPPTEVLLGVVTTNPSPLIEDQGAFTVNLTGTYADVDSSVTASDSCQLDVLDTNITSGNFSPTVPLNACTCDVGAQTCQLNLTPKLDINGTFTFHYQIRSGAALWSTSIARSISITAVNDFPYVTRTSFITKNLTSGVDAAAVLTNVNGAGGVLTAAPVLPAAPPAFTVAVTAANQANITGQLPALFIDESTTTIEQAATLEITTTQGGSGTETSQAVTITSVTSSDTTLVAPTYVGNIITFEPVMNKSGVATITITLRDGTDTANSGRNISVQSFVLTVNPVDDYPFFSTSACTFNRRTNVAANCVNAAGTAINCAGTDTPASTTTPVTANAVGVYFWDAVHTRCYKSTAANSSTAWLDQPMSPSLVDMNEGGEAQIEFSIDEDRVNTADENSQGITIVSATPDNTNLINTAGITAFYDLNDNGVMDSGEERGFPSQLETNAGDDSNLHKLYLRLKPYGGISGNTNITLQIDDGVSIIYKSFSLVIHPIAALHGGWTNIAASGIKTDKFGSPVDVADMQCNYNKVSDVNACADVNGNIQDCLGTSNPHSIILPKAANVIFWDSANKKCYRAQGPPTDKFSWIAMNTSCPVTRDASGDNWIRTAATPPTPTVIGQYYYAYDSKTCYISTTIDSTIPVADRWTTYVPSKVTLSWNNFTMSGTGSDANVSIAGWNIYRREINGDYNFINGFLKDAQSTTQMTIASPLTRTFVDKTAIAGKVYFYTVRPADSIRKIATHTPEVFTEVRVLAPPENFTYIHRWTINQEICNSMGMTTTTTNKVDPTHNYRCPYSGPGESPTAAGYYDYGKDLLVDISEMGCPYSPAPECAGNGYNNGCIGNGPPSITPSSNAGIYYDRSSGSCYSHATGSWAPYTNTALTLGNTALNPPLTHITAVNAATSCSLRTAPAVNPAHVTIGAVTLPEKKDYMAYSAPPKGANDTLLSDTQISDLEQGESLDTQSRCNSSSADAVQAGFTDAVIPSSTYAYAQTGTFASNVRSVVTGSAPIAGIFASTEGCVSRYGVQDVYGNVAEWVKDSMVCADTGGAPTAWNYPKSCMASNGTAMGYNFGTISLVGSIAEGAPATYGFDGFTGPFNDLNSTIIGPDTLDGYLTEWNFTDRLFSGTNFSFPLGLPIHTEINNAARITLDPAKAAPTVLDIGTGITTAQLHGDRIIVNAESVVGAGTFGTGYFAVGGSYLSGVFAGRYTMELIPAATDTRPDVGFRCVVPVVNYAADAKHLYGY